MNPTLSAHYYFDWAATAPADTAILQESLATAAAAFGNPSSVHAAGLEAKELLSDARKRAATILGVPESTLYFTSGGTESDYLPMLSLLQRPNKGSILISAIEHPAVREQAAMMKHCGWNVIAVQPDTNGIVSPEAVLGKLSEDTALVCIMAVNNETGAIQPVYDIADALTAACAGKKRPKLHVDAVQALGKIPLHLSHPGIDTAAMSAHKICGPRGIGLLYMAQRQEPFIRGGGQESGIRSGTENLFGAIAFSRCIEKYAVTDAPESEAQHVLQAQKHRIIRFIGELKKISGCRILPESRQVPDTTGYDERFSPWIVQASFAGIPGEVMVRALSEKGMYISTGSACSARKMTRPVLEAMHIRKEEAATAVRFSFGPATTDESVDVLLNGIRQIRALF